MGRPPPDDGRACRPLRRTLARGALSAALGAALALSAVAPASAGFSSRRTLVVRGARIVGGPHVDFPVLVSIQSPQLRTVPLGGGVYSAGGYDLEFRASDMVTVLDHEVESYDPATGTLVAWVRFPSLTSGVDVTFHLYFGDASIRCARNNPRRVWNSGYRYVYHLAETAGNPLDSTANAVPATRNPTADPAMVESLGVTGWIGRALDLVSAPAAPPTGMTSTPTHVLIDDGALPADPAVTMEAWFQIDTRTTGTFYGFHGKGRETTAWVGEYLMPQGVNHRFGLGWPLPAGNVQNIPALATGQWYHGVVTSTGGANPTRTVYLDGAQIASSNVAASLASIGVPARLGDDTNGNYLDGQLDEIRSSSVARSGSWIATTYQNHRCPSTSVLPAGCAALDYMVDDSAAAVPAALPSFSNATTPSGLGLNAPKEGGLAAADFNQDGCPDLLVNTSSAGVGSHLFLQQKSDRCTSVFVDVTQCLAGSLLTAARPRSVIWGDLDNDGDLDFAVNSTDPVDIYRNNGPGVTAGAGCGTGIAWSRFGVAGAPTQTITGGNNREGLGFLDYDADGDLDLITADQSTGAVEIWANNGAGTLALAAGTGLPASGTGSTDYAAVADYDADGDVDYLVRSDVAVDLYRNDGGTFGATAFNVAAANANKGGAAFCDLDNDGDFDLVWTDAPVPTQAFEQTSPGVFVARTALSGVGLNIDGVACGDVDNDGDVDVVLTETGRDYVLRNDGGWSFTDVTPTPVAGFGAGAGAGVVLADSDRDGDLDILINQSGANEYWRNELGSRNYLMVRPLTDPDGGGPGVPRDALGATVTLHSCGGALVSGVREVNGGEGKGTQSPAPLHFGLPMSGDPMGPGQAYVVRVQYVGGTVRQKAVVPALLGCYQQVTITDTDADDTSVCAATAVELMSFRACGEDEAAELRWQTASELQNLGFNLYRSSGASGPWEKLTPTLIPGLGSRPVGQEYSYRDPGLRNGERYYYELEDVETTGATMRHGPVWAEPSPGHEPGTCRGGLSPVSEPPPAAPHPVELGASAVPTEEREVFGRPEEASLVVLDRGPDHVTLELRTPGFFGVRESEGTLRLEALGFREGAEAAAPAVPLRDAVVDVPAGRRVRISSVRASRIVRFDGLRLSGNGEPALEVDTTGVVRPGRRPRRARLAGPAGSLFPARWTGPVETAFQGSTKKARIALNPLRYDASSGTVYLARRLRVRLEFAGVAPGERVTRGTEGRKRRSPTRPRRARVFARLATGAAGLYAVRFEEVLGRAARPVPLSGLTLSRLGVAVPFHVEPPGAFARGSTLYFVGGGDLSPWGDAVYELARGTGGVKMPVVRGVPAGPLVAEYVSTARFEENRIFQPGLLEAPDLWLWENILSPGSRTHSFDVPGLVESLQPARLRVWLQGGSDFEGADHHVRLDLNGTTVAEGEWDGRTEHVVEADVAPGLLREAGNLVRVENVGDLAAYSLVFLNRFEVSWPRRPKAAEGGLTGSFDRSGRVEIQLPGAALPGPDQASVVDTTDQVAWLRGVRRTSGDVAFRVEAGHRYVVATAPLRPTVRRARVSLLASRANRAEWLVVTPSAFADAARALVDWRSEHGLVSRLVTLEDVVDEFGYGEAGPEGLRRFLEYAYQEWSSPTLRYVLLLGDSTADPRDQLGRGIGPRLPFVPFKSSYLWTASDPDLGAVNGDDLVPDVAIGRLPAATADEAEAAIAKLLAFETDGRTPSGRAVLVADNPDGAGDFDAAQDEVASRLPRREVSRIPLGAIGAVAARAEVRWAFDSGAGLVSYVGHGGTAVWAGENILNPSDVAAFSAQAEQPLVLTLSCLNGYFVSPTIDSLAEALVEAPDRGAIAVVSPSGLAPSEPAQVFQLALVDALESGLHARLGDAMLAAQSEYMSTGAWPEILSLYHLFGDPALPLR